jgi:hypothetical protein
MSEKKKLPRATMAQAKAAWEAYPDSESDPRSFRKVIKVLEGQGLGCAISTLQRWKDSGWVIGNMQRANKDEIAKRKGERAAQLSGKVSEKTAEHEAKASTRLEVIAAEELAMKAERERLIAETVLDSDLARFAMRESLIAQIILARQIIRRAAVLVEVAPEIAAKVFEVLKGPAASTTIVIPPNEQRSGEDGDGAKVVEGRLVREPSPTQLAIESFRQRRREKQGVAA